VPAFPRTVQVQTVTGCNADCVFCPYGQTAADVPRGTMSWDLYRQVLLECARHSVRRISPYLMNEPLVDREIWRRIRLASRLVPRARITLTTNGSLLDAAAIEEILALGSSLHELSVSVQGASAESYEKTMGGGLTLDRTVANVLGLSRALRSAGARRPRLVVCMVGTRLIDVPAALAFWKQRAVRARVTRLDNQGGLMQIGPGLPLGTMVPNEPCPRPHKQAYVTFDGDVVVCCTDYRRSVVLGSLKTSSLESIWNGPLAVAIRSAHIERDRAAMPALCRDCRIDSLH
jgi:MoaA/NifB/PqqE/SkfB family radical SAM enzyme